MHHPDICEILLTIQDFLLLSEDRSNCEIIPYATYYDDLCGDLIRVQQVIIRRKLVSGWLEVIIHGLDEDSNLISCEYLTTLEPRLCNKTIEILWEQYSIDLVRDAIREILIMDKKPTVSSLDSIRNGINSLPSNETTKARFKGN
jgi:hypothetical protein